MAKFRAGDRVIVNGSYDGPPTIRTRHGDHGTVETANDGSGFWPVLARMDDSGTLDCFDEHELDLVPRTLTLFHRAERFVKRVFRRG